MNFKTTSSIILLLCMTLTTFSQDKKDNNILATVDELSVTVVNLRKNMGDGTEKTGTGFFLEKDGELFIVTAEHVAKHMNVMSDIILQGIDNRPIRLYLFKLSSLPNWQYHEKADLAILKLSPSKETINKYLQKRFLPYSILDLSENPVSRDTQLTIIGFPLGFGVQEYFSPLTFRSFPSSALITTKRADKDKLQTFILLEDPSIGGYSGGPVFNVGIIRTGNIKMSMGKTILHGIVHGTVSDSTGGAMAAITPSFYIKDFFK